MTASGADRDREPDSIGNRGVGRVLVVDDEKNIRSTLKMVLEAQGYAVDLAADGDAAEKILATTPPDVILLDVRMPGRSGLELLKSWRKSHRQVPVILMSGEATISEALEGLKDGAYDFIEKPFLQPRLINAIGRALERIQLRDAVKVEDDGLIVGTSSALRKVLCDVDKIAPLKTRVLITGESGTGKDLLARAIHRQSARAQKRFVKVNCAAIPSELIESELFGHVKGAFTGAITARRGVFEMANGGTLFLDEIGELSPAAQAKILRALQNGEITPVGSNLTIQVDVRVIAATNRDLKTEAEVGSFREDLYYRLAVVTLECPPLRAREGDVKALADFFAQQIRVENGLPERRLDAAVVEALARYTWPGNIRELRNVIERLMILGGPVIKVEDLPQEILASSRSAHGAVPGAGGPAYQEDGEIKNWETFKNESERSYLIQVLRRCSGNISETARVLAVERTTIHKWLKIHQIEKRHYF